MCLARAGRDATTPVVKGTYSAYGQYLKLDIVAMDGAAFISKRDNPGVCPGDDWQMISRQGRQGRRGEPSSDRAGQRARRASPAQRSARGSSIVKVIASARS
jgi:hypothetical protein